MPTLLVTDRVDDGTQYLTACWSLNSLVVAYGFIHHRVGSPDVASPPAVVGILAT
ncbi:MAG: hypothetical protein ACLQVK_11120 [Acidimicrobiales bacterium]